MAGRPQSDSAADMRCPEISQCSGFLACDVLCLGRARDAGRPEGAHGAARVHHALRQRGGVAASAPGRRFNSFETPTDFLSKASASSRASTALTQNCVGSMSPVARCSLAAPLKKALETLLARIQRDRSDQGSSPSSMPPRSLSQTSPSSLRTHRLPPGRAAASAPRRSGRRGCRST